MIIGCARCGDDPAGVCETCVAEAVAKSPPLTEAAISLLQAAGLSRCYPRSESSVAA